MCIRDRRYAIVKEIITDPHIACVLQRTKLTGDESFISNIPVSYTHLDLAYGVVFSIFASYMFSMTLVPLFCAKFIHPKPKESGDKEPIEQSENTPEEADKKKKPSIFQRGLDLFNLGFAGMLERYERLAYWMIQKPGLAAAVMLGLSLIHI